MNIFDENLQVKREKLEQKKKQDELAQKRREHEAAHLRYALQICVDDEWKVAKTNGVVNLYRSADSARSEYERYREEHPGSRCRVRRVYAYSSESGAQLIKEEKR